jgi:hypothetical protein
MEIHHFSHAFPHLPPFTSLDSASVEFESRRNLAIEAVEQRRLERGEDSKMVIFSWENLWQPVRQPGFTKINHPIDLPGFTKTMIL